MPEALAYLTDFLAEGAADVTDAAGSALTTSATEGSTAAAAGATASKAAATKSAATTPKVQVKEAAAPTPEKEEAPTVIDTTPVPKEANAPTSAKDLVSQISVPSLPSLSSLPEPGGIGLLLFLILLILFAFQQAGKTGETRLQLLWSVISGNASLAGDDSGKSGGGDSNITGANGTMTLPGGAVIPMTPGLGGTLSIGR